MRPRLALLLLAAAAFAGVEVRLDDGRVLHGSKRRTAGDTVVLETEFGPLSIPRERLATGKTVARKEPGWRTIKTRWLLLECDLSEKRAQLYADQLDTFFDWMVKVYELDLDRVRRDAPYRMNVYRQRADFKKVQAEDAPGIEQKGQAFAEGVAGFFSAGLMRIYLWDAEGGHGGVHIEVAKHETTHLLNHLLARQLGLRVPTWFEEGAATYFSMFVQTGGQADTEPEDHPGAFAQVVGEIEGKDPLPSRALRSVPWAEFHGREYSWGWAHVRFFRRYKRGTKWSGLLDYLRTVAFSGVSDSEERRYLDMAGFRDSKAFDRALHDHLVADKPEGRRAPVGTSPEILARVAKLKKPDPQLARYFARIGMSLARARESAPAIVYLRAALRGDVNDADVPYYLAVALSEKEGLARDDGWPAEAVAALERAVALAPLRTIYRVALGRQREGKEARDMLGLALLVAGPDDDALQTALALVAAAARLEPGRPAEEVVTGLKAAAPGSHAALDAALLYHYQEEESWDELSQVLQRRIHAGTATAEERAMLAGLFKASDMLEDASEIYAALLKEDPAALRYWPDLVECLAALGRIADARDALEQARAALKREAKDHGWIRRRLDAIDLGGR